MLTLVFALMDYKGLCINNQANPEINNQMPPLMNFSFMISNGILITDYLLSLNLNFYRYHDRIIYNSET